MRIRWVVAWTLMAILVPTLGTAQVFHLPASDPAVTAEGATWAINDEPVFYAGQFYRPTGPTVFFDGNVMVRTGTFRGVPLYEDSTLEPYSIVYVPIGGRAMRPYERRRAGELVGTVGSRMPSFPIERDGDAAVTTMETGLQLPVPEGFDREERAGQWRPGRRSGAIPDEARGRRRTARPRMFGAAPQPDEAPRPLSPAMTSIPGPTSNDGIWVTFDGARWVASGSAVPFDSRRFVRVGDLAGYPVYRDRQVTSQDEIYIPATERGPVAPFVRR